MSLCYCTNERWTNDDRIVRKRHHKVVKKEGRKIKDYYAFLSEGGKAAGLKSKP